MAKEYAQNLLKRAENEIEDINKDLQKEVLSSSETFLGDIIDTRAKRDALIKLTRIIKAKNENLQGLEDMLKYLEDEAAMAFRVILSHDAIYVRYHISYGRELNHCISLLQTEYKMFHTNTKGK